MSGLSPSDMQYLESVIERTMTRKLRDLDMLIDEKIHEMERIFEAFAMIAPPITCKQAAGILGRSRYWVEDEVKRGNLFELELAVGSQKRMIKPLSVIRLWLKDNPYGDIQKAVRDLYQKEAA